MDTISQTSTLAFKVKMGPDFIFSFIIDGIMHDFTFICLDSEMGCIYQVMVKSLNSKTHFFKMFSVDGSWKIRSNALRPVWIDVIEKQLAKAIDEKQQSYQR